MNTTELAVRRLRQGNSISPFVKRIDTVTAKFPAFTNHLYTTYNAVEYDGALSVPLTQLEMACSLADIQLEMECSLAEIGISPPERPQGKDADDACQTAGRD